MGPALTESGALVHWQSLVHWHWCTGRAWCTRHAALSTGRAGRAWRRLLGDKGSDADQCLLAYWLTHRARPIETTIGTPIGTTAKRTIETTIGTAIGTTIRTIACGRRQTDTRAAGATDNRFSWQARNNHQTTTNRAIRLLSTERWKRSSEQPARRRRRFFICAIKATTRRATGGGQPVGESFVLPDPQQRDGQPSNRGHRATGRATAGQPRTLATAG